MARSSLSAGGALSARAWVGVTGQFTIEALFRVLTGANMHPSRSDLPPSRASGASDKALARAQLAARGQPYFLQSGRSLERAGLFAEE